MKKIALIANATFLIFIAYMTITEGIPNPKDFWIFCLIFAFPILNIIALRNTNKNEDWLSLWLQRKALEEKKRIEKLNS